MTALNQTPHDLTAADWSIDQSTAERIARAVPAETRRAYRGDWNRFSTWCAEHDRTPLPAAAETLAVYCAYLADLGRAVGTIERAIAAIRKAHRVAHVDTPDTAAARLVLRSAGHDHADHGRSIRKAQALAVADLRAMLRHAAGTAATRDRALVLVGWAAALRRSELVALDTTDIAFTDNGAEITVRRSKSDKLAAGAVVALPYGTDPATCPVTALETLVATIDTGPLFRRHNAHGPLTTRLTAQSVTLILKRLAGLAGIDPAAVSGHSLRRGFATEARRNGADLIAVCRHGRWTDGSRSVMGYFADVDRWNDSPLNGIGL